MGDFRRIATSAIAALPKPSKERAMTDLVERLEAASGPCRELDCRIWCERQGNDFDTFRSVVHDLGQWIAPAYTASIDAALTLTHGFSNASIWMLWNDALRACSCAEGDLIKDLPRFIVIEALKARGGAG